MKKRVFLLNVVLMVSMLIAPARAVTQQQGDVQLRTNEVLLDLVATDKKGNPVTDLHQNEIQVLENGEPQAVTSFGLVRAGKVNGGVAGPDLATSPDAPVAISKSLFHGINLIIIIVDRTSVVRENLAQVFKSSEKFVNERLALNDMVAVFANTNRPVMLQNFTNNKPKLLEALKHATGHDSELHEQQAKAPGGAQARDGRDKRSAAGGDWRRGARGSRWCAGG